MSVLRLVLAFILIGSTVSSSQAALKEEIDELESNDHVQIVEISETKNPPKLANTVIRNSFIANEDLKCKMTLGELIVMDSLFNDSDMLEANSLNLRDLLIIDYILNQGCLFGSDNKFNISDLFVLDRLLDQDNALLDKGYTSIEDLIVLDQLFNN